MIVENGVVRFLYWVVETLFSEVAFVQCSAKLELKSFGPENSRSRPPARLQMTRTLKPDIACDFSTSYAKLVS